MKEKMIVFLLFILILLNGIIIFIKNYHDQILIIGGSMVIEYKNNKILKIKNLDKINNKLNYEKYSVYNKGNIEDYYINFDYGEFDNFKSNLYNISNEKINLSETLLAYTNGLNIRVSSTDKYYIMSDDDKKLINKVLPNYDLNSLIFNKIIVDLNNDNINEEIFVVNNFNLVKIPDRTICYVFLKKSNGEIIDIVKNESSDQREVPSYSFVYAVDIDNDEEYEMIFARYFNNSKINYIAYKYNSKNDVINSLNK